MLGIIQVSKAVGITGENQQRKERKGLQVGSAGRLQRGVSLVFVWLVVPIKESRPEKGNSPVKTFNSLFRNHNDTGDYRQNQQLAHEDEVENV